MIEPFEQASYLAQVLRLRGLAERALRLYPIRAVDCRLISHAENTTFRITAENGQTFLLRVHRSGYHNQPAILEEMRWLERLSKDPAFLVPRPLRSRQGRLVEEVSSPLVSKERHCCLFEWIDGRFIRKSVKPSHLTKVGDVIGKLHRNAKHLNVIHRRYWDADGLVGTSPKFGSIDHLTGISTGTQKIVTKGREIVFDLLSRFENRFPEKQGLIHADLHFDNVILHKDRIAVIDFDDCGFGFHAYDLAVSLRSALGMATNKKKASEVKEVLIEAYAKNSGWDRNDEAILPHLMAARRLCMLGWLHSRSDNPQIRRHLNTAVKRTQKYLHEQYGL